MVSSGSVVYVGGAFGSAGGKTRKNLAALDAANGAATAFASDVAIIGPEGEPDVRSLALAGSVLYVGGDFDQVGGQARDHLAAVDATTGVTQTWNPGTDAGVTDIAVSGAIVYIAGSFSSVAGAARSGLAAVDTVTSFNPHRRPPASRLA